MKGSFNIYLTSMNGSFKSDVLRNLRHEWARESATLHYRGLETKGRIYKPDRWPSEVGCIKIPTEYLGTVERSLQKKTDVL